MVTNFQKQAPSPNPEVMSTSWLEEAMKNWGPGWGDIVFIGIPAKVDYYDPPHGQALSCHGRAPSR
eukprot:3789904-Karenia_brevis.AAC.1